VASDPVGFQQNCELWSKLNLFQTGHVVKLVGLFLRHRLPVAVLGSFTSSIARLANDGQREKGSDASQLRI
jgi:hypothetical protein